ncbi:hypothetical protein EPD83_009165 [Phycicoccus sp. CMS6Z-2]|uniref:Uncharacterized protein n=2 Tax=Phycicoccus flavus TaxID=2502783 RepID=A0A8T6R407_9MICO|nr:hypothetical protein [Phycicoccus flavus]
MATAAGTGTVLECAGPATSGLAAAATAELGPDAAGWARGTRGPVALVRPAGPVRVPGEVPVPAQGQAPVIVDVAWDPGTVLAGTGWLAELLRRPGPLVVVVPATVPGLRRLELSLHQLRHALPTVALVGARHRDRAVNAALDAVTTGLHLTADRVVPVLWDARLATRGLDSTPIPPRLLHAADRLLQAALPGRTTP